MQRGTLPLSPEQLWAGMGRHFSVWAAGGSQTVSQLRTGGWGVKGPHSLLWGMCLAATLEKQFGRTYQHAKYTHL